MYIVHINCVCPQIHKFDCILKKKKKDIPSVAGELQNKDLVGTKVSMFCPECQQVTVVIVEDVLDITKESVVKPNLS